MARALILVFLLVLGCDSAEERPDAASSGAGGRSGAGGSGGNAGAGAVAGTGEAGQSGSGGEGASAGASAGASGRPSGLPPERCTLPPEPGPCEAAIPRYYFDEGRCREFMYGGCEGNENNFATLEECYAECQRYADVCYSCEADGACGDALSDCSNCPPDRQAQGDACVEQGLNCYFLPACGATDCTCTAGPSGTLTWECRTNACKER